MPPLDAPVFVLNYRRYGVVGDGVSADTEAVSAWLKDLALMGGIGIVPPGYYRVPGLKSTVLDHPVSLQAVGDAVPTFDAEGAATDHWLIVRAPLAVTGLAFKNFNAIASSATAGSPFFRNLGHEGPIKPILARDIAGISITRCRFDSCRLALGLSCDASVAISQVVIANNEVRGGWSGFHLEVERLTRVRVSGNRLFGIDSTAAGYTRNGRPIRRGNGRAIHLGTNRSAHQLTSSDWLVTDNTIDTISDRRTTSNDKFQPELTGIHAIGGSRVIIARNRIVNVAANLPRDSEAIYAKLVDAVIRDNVIHDCGLGEGAINLKGGGSPSDAMGARITVEGNELYGTKMGNGIAIQCNQVICRNNYVHGYGSTNPALGPIYVSRRPFPLGDISVVRNIITRTTGVTAITARSSGDRLAIIENVVVDLAKHMTAKEAPCAIFVRAGTDAIQPMRNIIIDGNILLGNWPTDGDGIRVRCHWNGVDYVHIAQNRLLTKGATAIDVRSQPPARGVHLEDNAAPRFNRATACPPAVGCARLAEAWRLVEVHVAPGRMRPGRRIVVPLPAGDGPLPLELYSYPWLPELALQVRNTAKRQEALISNITNREVTVPYLVLLLLKKSERWDGTVLNRSTEP